MASEVEICNLAISHLGSGKEIANITTENSQEANACRRFFDTCRDMTLRTFAWPFATKIDDLALIELNPNDEWGYSYRYPTDCLDARRILSGVRNDDRASRVSYKIAKDSSGRVVFTDQEDAQLEYTVRVNDPSFFPEDFTMALSFALAFYVAPRITAGDPFKLGDRSMKLFEHTIAQAKATAMNEEQVDEAPDSEFIQVRE